MEAPVTSPRNWLRSWVANRPRTPARRNNTCLSAEALEDRVVPTSRAFSLNDPNFPTSQWGLNNTGQPNTITAAGGTYGVDIDMPAAWAVTTGQMTTVVALLDDGVDYTSPDLYLNIWLNQGEIPAGLKAGLTDTDSD